MCRHLLLQGREPGSSAFQGDSSPSEPPRKPADLLPPKHPPIVGLAVTGTVIDFSMTVI